MASNIDVIYDNFCIAPIVGTYASVDNSDGSNTYLRVKNDSGATTGSYTFNPRITLGQSIYGLEYIGARGKAQYSDDMVFFTMESNTSSTCTITKWKMDTTLTELVKDYSFTKTSDTVNKFACRHFAIDRYFRSFGATTTTGTGFITIDTVEPVTSGTKLYLGPSNNVNNYDVVEEVTVTAVSGTTVYISSSGGTAPIYYYNSGDDITVEGNTYLFSNTGQNGDTSKGTLYVLDTKDGTILRKHDSGIYKDIMCAGWPQPYPYSMAFIKNNDTLYVDIDNFQLTRAHRINTALSNKTDYETVYDLEYDQSSIYRLQRGAIYRDDGGNIARESWTNYNFQLDAVARYTDTLAMYASVYTLRSQQTTTVYALVRDQFGIGVQGKTVTFDRISGDSNGEWGNVNRQAVTDINGIASITYTSAWYDKNLFIPAKEDILLSAETDGSNIVTGSVYVWGFMSLKLDAIFLWSSNEGLPYGMPIVTQKRDERTITSSLEQLEPITSTLGMIQREKYERTQTIRQLRSFDTTAKLTQLEDFGSTASLKQLEEFSDNMLLSQNIVSRHHTTGNQDTVNITQFRFMLDMRPPAYSEKNNVGTDIWVKIGPSGYDLDQSTLSFKVKEVSYAGDTGYIEYANTPLLAIAEFTDLGGLIGLEVTYTPAEYFHNNAVVFVRIELYDKAPIPNIIWYDYWFTIIPDYNAPYLTNLSPGRGETDVSIDTNISFDIIDNEVGVDIDTLEVYINNRFKTVSHSPISKGYSVVYENEDIFYYTQPVEVSVLVRDISGQGNVLYDQWTFTIESSEPPYVHSPSVYPKVCSYGTPTRTTLIKFDVFDAGDGLDPDSIRLLVDSRERTNLKKTPIIMRIK